MIRKIVCIDEMKCTGCGECAMACHEGAIAMIGGKAKLIRDDYCDGLGDCLPSCPAGAITIEEREAVPYNEEAVNEAKAQKPLACGCPGSLSRSIERKEEACPCHSSSASHLANWPVQIRLAPVEAPYFDSSDLLIAADCSAYAYGAFQEDFIRGRVTLVGCPKLDAVDYKDKLSLILENNDIRSVTLVRMEVPCCGGLEAALRNALKACGRDIPIKVVTISVQGEIL